MNSKKCARKQILHSSFFILHLFKNLLAIHDVDALLHLVQALTSEVEDVLAL